jgi:predicted Zn-dependent peptidase
MGGLTGRQPRPGFAAGHHISEANHAWVRHLGFGMNDHLFVVAGGRQIAAGGFRHRQQNAILGLHIAVSHPARTAPLDTAEFHPHQVVGVVDDSHLVGFSKADAEARLDGGHNVIMRNLLLLLAFAATAAAQDLKDFEKRVTEFTLPNGLHFIILERHEAPVVSFHTYVNAGSVDDSNGKTGIAHMFEHMAFKGTESMGSKNLALEKQALANIEKVYDQLDQEKRKGAKADAAKVKELEAKLKDAIASADSYVDSELYTRVMEDNGAVGLNASTGVDATQYFLSYPSNRAELWFLMESDRFRNGMFREFYKERDVVREEKRMRSESSPQGELIDALLAAAFQGHPYKTSPAGFASDIENYRVGDAKAFRDTYYVPSNMTIAIAGDIDPKEARRLAEKYFGPMPAGPMPPPVITVEPNQNGERRVAIQTNAQPMVIAAYKRPEQTHPDDVVFDVIQTILSSGRTGRIYKELVDEKKLALGAGSVGSFPGGKYPNLFLIYSFPNAGKTVEENEQALYAIVEKLKTEPVDEVTLKRVKTKVRAQLVRQLGNNSGLAELLTFYHVNFGDWRMLFQGVEEIEKVTAADVQRVANKYFDAKSRTVAYHVKPAKEKAE